MNNPADSQIVSTFVPCHRHRALTRFSAALALVGVLSIVNVAQASFSILETSPFTIGPTATLNLTSNGMIVRGGIFSQYYQYVVKGYNGGDWLGTGGAIRSSTAASDPTHLTGLGIINNADFNYPSWNGRSLPVGDETLVRYTYYGDANLDFDVDAADLALMGTGTGWEHGDFNYDGVVNAADYALLNASLATLHPESVPEPACGSLLAVGALLALRRRPAAR